MSDREKLIALLGQVDGLSGFQLLGHYEQELVADHLIANGVVVRESGVAERKKEKIKTEGDLVRSMRDEDLAWELFGWRMDGYLKGIGEESLLPDTQKTICAYLKRPLGERSEKDGRNCTGTDDPGCGDGSARPDESV